jgi:2-oxoglutarate ferredoxin oxidoreductase subunit beta
VALGAGATFVARSVDVYAPHLKDVLVRAAKHTGTSFMEILQNCNIFNDGAFEAFRDKELRDDNVVNLKHGEPLIFGKAKDKGIRMKGPVRARGRRLGRRRDGERSRRP